jgi:hypothetical protein
MERWIGSRSVLGILALGAGLLALAAALTKFRVGAEEAKEALPKAAVAAKPKRESLRYGGKSFDQWRVEMETELKPEVRADGMTAMAAFGANGYGAEATRTIVDLMAGYDLKSDFPKDKDVVDAALQAIVKIGEPSFPVLWKSILSDNERSRLFAINCFHHFSTDWHPPVADLLKAARNDDVNVREMALMLLKNVKNKPKSCLPVLLECLNDKELDVRDEAIYRLDEMHPEAKEVMPALRTAITASEPRVRSSALRMVGHYGAQAKPLVPELVKRLEKPDSLVRGFFIPGCDEFVALMEALAAIGPDAKEALPRLRKLREEPGSYGDRKSDLESIDQAIKKIEGTSADAPGERPASVG